MSYVSSLSSSSSLYSTVATTTSNSLRPFANLDLTEDQRTQIRAIFQQAKSQGLSQSQVQQAINAVLTPAQQQTLQTDIQQQAQTQPTQGGSAGSTNGTPPNPFADPNGPFANLNLTSSQQSQISQLLQTAQSTGVSISQLNAQINAVLSPAQQSTFATDLQNLPQPGSQPDGASSSATDLTANLSLTDAQKSQIDQILQQAQAGTITQQQALSQITSVLTPAQQTALQQDEQTAQTNGAGHHHHHHGGAPSSTSSTTSTATLPSGVTEADIQNQVAAATSVILNNLQADVTSST